MPKAIKMDRNDRDIPEVFRDLLTQLLINQSVQAVLVQTRLPYQHTVMPTLITDPELLQGADPLAPGFPMNTATMVARLSRKPMGGPIAVVLRPCEIRALMELIKLHQANRDELILIGFDCPGALTNRDYAKFAAENPDASTNQFIQTVLIEGNTGVGKYSLATACRACEHPVPENTDIRIRLFGMSPDSALVVDVMTALGETCLKGLGDWQSIPSDPRDKAVDQVISARIAFRDEMFQATDQRIDSIEKLSDYFAHCINCYNCRVACPVCYCRECVFVTDAFRHEPYQYLNWARRKGAVKMPTDTVFYHLTRLAHMSLACVGCGQCSNACPNEIAVMEIFRTVAHRTQKAFDYEAGRSAEEVPPLADFREDEFDEIVGVAPKG